MRHPHRLPAQPIAHQRAHGMRKHLTFSEQKLWQELRGSKLGVAFRRQVPIGRFIADFAAPSVRLVVEVDGGYHAQRKAADARRDRDLARAGWRVLRLDAALVVQRLPEAVERMRQSWSHRLKLDPRAVLNQLDFVVVNAGNAAIGAAACRPRPASNQPLP